MSICQKPTQCFVDIPLYLQCGGISFLPSWCPPLRNQHLGANMKYDKFNNHSSISLSLHEESISIDSSFEAAPFFISAEPARQPKTSEFTPGRTNGQAFSPRYGSPTIFDVFVVKYWMEIELVCGCRSGRRGIIRRNKLNLSSFLNPSEDSLTKWQWIGLNAQQNVIEAADNSCTSH